MRGVTPVRAAAGLVLVSAMLGACAATTPPARLGQYLGGPSAAGAGATLGPDRLRAALVVVPDRGTDGTSPTLPEGALAGLAEDLKGQFTTYLPLDVQAVLSAEGLKPEGGLDQFIALGRQRGFDYVLVVIASATEREYPIGVFVAWVVHSQPGLRRDNWSLLEVALVDVRGGRVLVEAEGRGWATLDRPTAPDIRQWYPVVWKRPLDPNRPFYPLTDEGAADSLRVIAMQEAEKRLVPNFQDAWIAKRRMALALDGR